MLHSSRFKASAFPFGISGLDRFSFLPAHLLTCVRLKLPVTRSPPTLGYGLVVSLCPTGFPPALCNDLAQPHEPSPLLFLTLLPTSHWTKNSTTPWASHKVKQKPSWTITTSPAKKEEQKPWKT